jgi:hypothetical protein
MQERILRKDETILWQAKPKFTKNVLISTLIRILAFPCFVTIGLIIFMSLGILFKLVDSSIFVMLICVFMPISLWFVYSLAHSVLRFRSYEYVISNQRVLLIQNWPKRVFELDWQQVQAVAYYVLTDGFHSIQINHLLFSNLSDSETVLSMIKDHAPDAFVQEATVNGTIESQLAKDEEILWRGNPQQTTVHWQELIAPSGMVIFLLVAVIAFLFGGVFIFAWFVFVLIPFVIYISMRLQKISRLYADTGYLLSNKRIIIANERENRITAWSPLGAIQHFKESETASNLRKIDMGNNIVFANLTIDQCQELMTLLAPYLPAYDKAKREI